MEKDDYDLVNDAAKEAVKKFNEVIKEEDRDPAYFACKLKGFILQDDFKNTHYTTEHRSKYTSQELWKNIED